jgi:hypothetical protein
MLDSYTYCVEEYQHYNSPVERLALYHSANEKPEKKLTYVLDVITIQTVTIMIFCYSCPIKNYVIPEVGGHGSMGI